MLLFVATALYAMQSSAVDMRQSRSIVIAEEDVRCLSAHLDTYLQVDLPVIFFRPGSCPRPILNPADFGGDGAASSAAQIRRNDRSTTIVLSKPELLCLVHTFRRLRPPVARSLRWRVRSC